MSRLTEYEIAKEGYLMKRGARVKNWRKRHFVLLLPVSLNLRHLAAPPDGSLAESFRDDQGAPSTGDGVGDRTDQAMAPPENVGDTDDTPAVGQPALLSSFAAGARERFSAAGSLAVSATASAASAVANVVVQAAQAVPNAAREVAARLPARRRLTGEGELPKPALESAPPPLPAMLVYAKGSEDQADSPLGCIVLNGSESLAEASADQLGSPPASAPWPIVPGRVIALRTEERTWLLSAASVEDYQRWTSLLSDAISAVDRAARAWSAAVVSSRRGLQEEAQSPDNDRHGKLHGEDCTASMSRRRRSRSGSEARSKDSGQSQPRRSPTRAEPPHSLDDLRTLIRTLRGSDDGATGSDRNATVDKNINSTSIVHSAKDGGNVDDENLVSSFFRRSARSVAQTARTAAHTVVGQPLSALGHAVGELLSRGGRGGRNDVELALSKQAFNQFLECLYSREEPAPTVAKELFERVAVFDGGATIAPSSDVNSNTLPGPVSAHPRAGQFLKLVRETTDQLASSRLFEKHMSSDLLYDCIETHLSQMVYPMIYPLALVATGGTNRDQLLQSRIDKLSFVEPAHLGIRFAATQARRRAWCLAGAELWQLSDSPSPWEKMCRLLDCCRYIYASLSDDLPRDGEVDGPEHSSAEEHSTDQRTGTEKLAAESEEDLNLSQQEEQKKNSASKGSSSSSWTGADDFLPVLIYVILRSRPPRMSSEIDFIGAHRNPSVLDGEEGYYLISMETAVTFIEQCSAADLGLSEEQFSGFNDSCRDSLDHDDANNNFNDSSDAPDQFKTLSLSSSSELGAVDSLRKRFHVEKVSSADDGWELVEALNDSEYSTFTSTADGAASSSPKPRRSSVKCTVCQKRFVNNEFLRQHLKNKH